LSGDAKRWAGLWRFLARCSFPDKVWAAAYVDLSYTELGLLGTEPVACSSDDLTDLGLMQIPPWPEPEDDASEAFKVKLCRTGTGSWWFDYVMLIPVGEGYRKLWYEEDAAPYQEYLVDDGILDEVAQGDATRAGVVRAAGRRIELVPGVDQRIYFSMVGNAGSAEIDRTVDVVIEIVPRYRFFED